MPVKEIKFYLIQGPHRGSHVFKWLSPNNSGRWENIFSVDEIDEADYVVVIQTAGWDLSRLPPERIVHIQREPDEFFFTQYVLDSISPLSHKYRVVDNYAIQLWDLIWKSYDELKNEDFPPKTKNLSWVTTTSGDGNEPSGIQVLTGHRLRMQFLQNFLKKFPDQMDLFGRGLVGPKYNYECNKGELFDKWYGLEKYRYTFSFENSWQRGYFTDDICDGIFAGCMPIFWGCPNLEEFLPEGSFIRLDITREDAPERAMEIVNSDFRERHLDALREAKKLILDKYNLWPSLHRILNEIDQKSGRGKDATKKHRRS